MKSDEELGGAHRNLRDEMAPGGVGTGFIPSAEGEFETATHAEPIARSQWALFRRRFVRHKVAMASIVVLFLLVIMCFGASYIAPYSNTDQDLLLGSVAPGAKHWRGPTSSAETSSPGCSTRARSPWRSDSQSP